MRYPQGTDEGLRQPECKRLPVAWATNRLGECCLSDEIGRLGDSSLGRLSEA
jgi:hypothetical protein